MSRLKRILQPHVSRVLYDLHVTGDGWTDHPWYPDSVIKVTSSSPKDYGYTIPFIVALVVIDPLQYIGCVSITIILQWCDLIVKYPWSETLII